MVDFWVIIKLFFSDIDEYDESYKVLDEQGYYSLVRQQGTPIKTGKQDNNDDNVSVDTGDILCDDEEDEDPGIEEDEDSTPHILSETSKTQSPVSNGM